MQELGNLKRGLLFVLTAPSGAGKTTLSKMAEKEFPCIVRSVSYTTRAPRQNEINGKDYFFVGEEDFKKKIDENFFLEYANVYGSFYGTSKKFVDERLNNGKHILLVIDTFGASQIRKNTKNAIFIFLMPPSKEAIIERLSYRNTETEAQIKDRILKIEDEMKEASLYNYNIVNDDLTVAYNVFRAIFIAEEHRVREERF